MNRPEMLGLWNLLLQSWGQKFAEQYGVTPNDAWHGALAQVSVDAAKHAFRRALRETPTFPPTLGEFIAWAQDYRPETSRSALGYDGRAVPVTIEELRRNASQDIAAFGSYREYERWRDSHTVKGKRPAHPESGSADWLYLQRLAWMQAAADNRRDRAA